MSSILFLGILQRLSNEKSSVLLHSLDLSYEFKEESRLISSLGRKFESLKDKSTAILELNTDGPVSIKCDSKTPAFPVNIPYLDGESVLMDIDLQSSIVDLFCIFRKKKFTAVQKLNELLLTSFYAANNVTENGANYLTLAKEFGVEENLPTLEDIPIPKLVL
jgi:hypothetical protein